MYYFLFPSEAQQGEALLWSSWLEKHPETELLSPEDPPPWDNTQTKAEWDQHAADTYYTYWGQYCYWSAQGWTTDQSVRTGNMDGEAAAGEQDMGSVDLKDGQTEGDSPTQSEDVDSVHKEVENLENQFEVKCTVNTDQCCLTQCVGTSAVTEQLNGHIGCSGRPHGDENDRKRPGGSTEQKTVKHTGTSTHLLYTFTLYIDINRYIYIYHKVLSIYVNIYIYTV